MAKVSELEHDSAEDYEKANKLSLKRLKKLEKPRKNKMIESGSLVKKSKIESKTRKKKPWLRPDNDAIWEEM